MKKSLLWGILVGLLVGGCVGAAGIEEIRGLQKQIEASAQENRRMADEIVKLTKGMVKGEIPADEALAKIDALDKALRANVEKTNDIVLQAQEKAGEVIATATTAGAVGGALGRTALHVGALVSSKLPPPYGTFLSLIFTALLGGSGTKKKVTAEPKPSAPPNANV